MAQSSGDGRNDHDGTSLPFFLIVMLALLILLFATGCGPTKRNPDFNPFPNPENVEDYNRKRQQRRPFLTIEQMRCQMGGGLGGCPGWLLRR